MKRGLVLCASLGLAVLQAACGEEGEKSQPCTGSDCGAKTLGVGAACTTKDATACEATKLLSCDGSVWVEVRDCASRSQVCQEISAGAGVFACADGRLVPVQGATCTIDGQESVGAVAFYDDDIFGYYTVISFAVTAGGGEIENQVTLLAAGVTAGMSVDFSQNTTIETCRQACLMGIDKNEKQYMASSGGVTFTQVGEVGGNFVATLSEVSMREVEFSDDNGTSDVANGATWCLDSLDLAAPVTRYACFALDLEVGGATCSLDGPGMISCQASDNDLGELVLTDCEEGSCQETVPGEATCE